MNRLLDSRIVSAAMVAVLVVLLHVGGVSDALNHLCFDAVTRLQADPARLPDDGMLVLIDEDSIRKLNQKTGERWPWSRDNFAALFAALSQAGAKHVVVDLIFLEASEKAEDDALLAAYAAASEGVVLAETGNKHQVIWTPEFNAAFPQWGVDRRVAEVRHEPDSDGVLRRYDYTRSLAAAAADESPGGTRLLRWSWRLDDFKRAHPERVQSAWSWLVKGQVILKESQKLLPPGGEFNPDDVSTALHKLPRQTDASIEGKTVFIGANFAAAYDTKATPLSRAEPGIMYHFTAWANAQNGDWIREEGGHVGGIVVAIVIAGFILIAGFRSPGIRAVAWTSFGCAVVGAVAWVLAWWPGHWVGPADPIFALGIGFTVVAARNWRRESARKMEVQNLFGNYVSGPVLDTLLKDPAAVRLGGERRELSVYFSDLAGFTDMSEGMESEQLLEVVNLYLSEMSPFIVNHGGYLDKFIGDAIMGVFGAPERLPNHAASACRAALESRDHLKVFSQKIEKDWGVVLYARYGVNSGDIVVGNVGSAKKVNYTVVGDAVNLASRLEGANKEFGTTILLGEKTKELAGPEFVTRPVELLRVKGKKKPVQTFELMALAAGWGGAAREAGEAFQSGYGKYQRREFREARADFEIARRLVPGDKLAEMYVQRCDAFVAEPPGPDWDGVFVMTKK